MKENYHIYVHIYKDYMSVSLPYPVEETLVFMKIQV